MIKQIQPFTNPKELIERLMFLATSYQAVGWSWLEISELIFTDQDMQVVTSLQDPKTSVCGQRIEQKTLSFQCFDCAPDPHHMFCVKCFELPKHKSHRFIMRHNIGGCCDCGDEKTINPSGACVNHAGYKYQNNDLELQKIPLPLQEKIKLFIKLIVGTYSSLVLDVNLNYPIYLSKALNYLQNLKLATQDLEQLISEEHKAKALKQQQGVYLYNIFVEFTLNIVKQRMPMIILITETLMERVNEDSEDTYLDLVVKSAAAIDGGHVPSKDIDEIMFAFHANPVFKELLQQILLKQYHNLKVLRKEPRGRVITEFLRLDKQFQELPEQRRQLYYQHQNIRMQFSKLIELIIDKEKKYAQLSTQGTEQQKQRKMIIVEYRAELHSHHTQFVSIEHQTEFFQSKYLANYFGQLREQYANLTQDYMDDFGLLLNTLYWLVLRTEYVFFPKIYSSCLEYSLSGDQLQSLQNLDSRSSTFKTDLVDQMKQTFYGQFIFALSGQKPAKLFDNNLFKKEDQASLLTIHYLFIQSNALGVWVGSFLRILSKIPEQNFRLNLLLVHAKICFQLICERNSYQGDLPKIRNLSYISGQQNPKQKLQYRLFMMNASALDRLFAILMVNCYFESGLSRVDFREYFARHLGTDVAGFLHNFTNIVGRALQSFFAISYAEIQNDVTFRIYDGKQNQQSVNLRSADSAGIKMYLFFGDQKEMDLFAQMLEDQSFQSQDSQMVKHSLMLDLLLGDMDLLNVTGLLYKDLPEDVKIFFQKFIRSIFMSQTYQSFTSLKQVFMNCGLLKQLPLADYLLEVCDLDPFIRELKLKPIFHDKPLYEPYILSGAPELVGQITENLMNKKDSNIDLFFGNGVDFDISVQKVGSIKFEIIQRLAFNQVLFQKLFGDYVITNINAVQQGHKKILAKAIYVFMKINTKYNIVTPSQVQLLQQIKQQLVSSDGTQQFGQEVQKVQNTQNIFNKLEELFSDQTQQLESQKEPTTAQNFELDQKKQELMMKKKQALLKKFQKEQQKFQQNFQDISDMVSQVEYDQCQQCKLPIENNQVISLPAYMTREHPVEFQKYGVPEKLVVMQSCKHKFHGECLMKHLKSVRYRIKLFHSSCPICRQGVNIVSNLLKNITEADELNNQISLYQETITEYLNFNYDLCDDINIQYVTFTKENLFNHLTFMEVNLRCIASQLIQLFQTPVEFLNSEKGDYELAANLVLVCRRFLSLDKFGEMSKDQIFTLLSQSYSSHGIIGRLMMTLLSESLNIQLKWEQTLNLTNDETILFEIASQIIHDPVKQFQPQDTSKIQDLIRIQEGHLNKQIQQTKTAKQAIGENFKEFYLKFFSNGCSKCNFFPVEIQHDGFAEQYVCIQCFKTFCGTKCQTYTIGQDQDLGNLNQHAVKDHCGQAVFISLITGFITLVLSPISIIDHKNIFYDKMGQKIKLLESQIDWSDYKIDERELQNAYDILKERKISQIICSNFGSDKPKKIDTSGSF